MGVGTNPLVPPFLKVGGDFKSGGTCPLSAFSYASEKFEATQMLAQTGTWFCRLHGTHIKASRQSCHVTFTKERCTCKCHLLLTRIILIFRHSEVSDLDDPSSFKRTELTAQKRVRFRESQIEDTSLKNVPRRPMDDSNTQSKSSTNRLRGKDEKTSAKSTGKVERKLSMLANPLASPNENVTNPIGMHGKASTSSTQFSSNDNLTGVKRKAEGKLTIPIPDLQFSTSSGATITSASPSSQATLSTSSSCLIDGKSTE